MKVGLDGQIDSFKARFIAKASTQIFVLDYSCIFSLMANIHHGLFHQLDIKNAFFHE